MCSHLSMPSTKPSDFGYGRAKPLVALFGRPVPVTKGDQGALEQRHAAQYVHWPGTGFCRQRADHPGGEHVMRNLQDHRLIKETQHRFVEKPIFELEARAEGSLADDLFTGLSRWLTARVAGLGRALSASCFGHGCLGSQWGSASSGGTDRRERRAGDSSLRCSWVRGPRRVGRGVRSCHGVSA